ncbi:glycosyl-4,4'-diaponeurosporenoate acyltransferase CrtO family protein [Hymenobacter latericus]|uniref:glycosyl-4,4'-diaponeurosporenoate acyltransferase CrtO family protein n=1 Tax=Hymenobacter sp. YIM 151858-1 TaxID=2987688 RepID=UPI002226DEBD|nr:hypothetical protein [Hymenobacter sp. YIM 151858-1]UYZ59837.1 hypothetical protein OIS50_03350 [Hymenobacter sp. YIM 151858-1]
MKKLGKSAFYLWVSAMLLLTLWSTLKGLLLHPGQPSVAAAFWLGGFACTTAVAGVFGMLGLAVPVHRLLGPGFYHCVAPSHVSWLYRALRVEWLRRFLCWAYYHKPRQRQAFYGGGRARLGILLDNTQGAEIGHLLAFAAQLLLLPYFLHLGRYDLAAGAAVGNLIGNFYPIVLQRYHRMRLLQLGLGAQPHPVRLHPSL